MQFVASITRNASDIRKLIRLWQLNQDGRNPLKNVLVTPLFTPPSTLNLIRQMREQGEIEQVYFDSGGYFVQMGRLTYEDMYWRLLGFYRQNDWADWYVLPDFVPLSSDDETEAWYKVRTTAKQSVLFFNEMPATLQDRAMPVVQGHSFQHIEHCVEKYMKLGVKQLGFGSFGTNGKESSVNSLTDNALKLLIDLSTYLSQQNINLHAFGVGNPPTIYLLDQIGVYSFDSVGWMKTAGYGKVFMPFTRAYNITYRDPMARGLPERHFQELKGLSGHTCYFCASFEKLTQSRDYRIMHNLAVVLDTLDMITAGVSSDFVAHILHTYSPSYARLNQRIFI
jgi:queuine/archaeosine tRNA-ribosyltransferase